MYTSRIRAAWAAGAGLLLTLTITSPAWGDDVELLLSTPSVSVAAKPNLLFILDSSGSMTGEVSTQPPYDPNVDYDGDCEADKYYWTTGSSIPTCGDQYKINQSAFVCQQGLVQMADAGSYTDTMAMYRPNWKGNWKWRAPSKSQLDRAVECEADSGVHSYGTSPGNDPYARIGTNVDPYTSDPNSEVDWGAKPTHRIVTVYDPNFLNWHHYSTGDDMRKTDIVQAVTKNVLGSMNDVNVGFMWFNWSEGGTVVQALKDLNDNRTTMNTTVDNLPASGWTPLSETMYEAALYLRGMSADYGDTASTDTDSLSTSDPMVYEQPVEYSCSKNFVVLLTDGEPTEDTGAYYDVPTLPGYYDATGRGTCTGTSGTDGACLDDVAEYLANADLNATVDGVQSATTYTIGFAVDFPLLQETADAGGGKYFAANNVAELTKALTEITSDIFNRDISFTAPAVAVNAFNRTQHLNNLYVSVFRAQDEVHWPGNLKKYLLKDAIIEDALENNAIDPDTGYFADSSKNFWQNDAGADGADVYRGGAANALPPAALRKVYTNNITGSLTTSSNALSTDNIGAFVLEDFGLTGDPGEPSMSKLIDWARGLDVKDEDNDGDSNDSRDAMGDTLHAQPAAVVYGQPDGSYDVVIYSATNDGYLHAIDADGGVEKWSFVPRELLANFNELYVNDNVDYKNYGLDGDVIPVVYDEDNDGVIEVGTDFVYLLFGMRRGGDNYYMVEVTNPDAPKLRWIKTYPELGQTWSAPVVAKINIDSGIHTSPQDAVVVIGGGYDTVHDAPAHPASDDVTGAGIMMLDLETGNVIWRAGKDNDADLTLAKMNRSIPGSVRVIDLNGDGLADRMYAADLGGQVWRFDISNGKKTYELVAGGVIAQLGAEGIANPKPDDTRRLYTTPDVAMFADKRQDRRFLAINVGSGYRAHPLDNSANDRFFSIRDPDLFTSLTQAQYDSYSVIKDSDLVEVSGEYGTVISAGSDGWRFTLPPNEKVLSDARTFDNSVYFVTMEPTVNSEDPCQAGLSVNRLYRLDVVNGDPIVDESYGVTLDPEEADDARMTALEQGGIAPKPTFFFPSPTDPNCTGDECAPAPVGCVGVECFDPGYENFPVRTLWTQDGIE